MTRAADTNMDCSNVPYVLVLPLSMAFRPRSPAGTANVWLIPKSANLRVMLYEDPPGFLNTSMLLGLIS